MPVAQHFPSSLVTGLWSFVWFLLPNMDSFGGGASGSHRGFEGIGKYRGRCGPDGGPLEALSLTLASTVGFRILVYNRGREVKPRCLLACSMHACLNVDEIVRLLASELVASGGKEAAAALACCCKSFEDPVLDALWEALDQLRPLLKSFPADVLDDKGGKFVSAPLAFHSISTKLSDWAVFQ